MADRFTLHWNHLDEFKTWLGEIGWRVVPSPHGNGFEVLRAKHPEQKHPVIFYSRLANETDTGARGNAAQHLDVVRSRLAASSVDSSATVKQKKHAYEVRTPAGDLPETDKHALSPSTLRRIATGIDNYMKRNPPAAGHPLHALLMPGNVGNHIAVGPHDSDEVRCDGIIHRIAGSEGVVLSECPRSRRS